VFSIPIYVPKTVQIGLSI